MKYIKLSYVLLVAVLSLLWLIAEPLVSIPPGFFPLRSALIYYTGVIGMGAMSVGMMLALRPMLVEPFLGGLDKSYRLHKWLGITGLVFAVLHWGLAKVPKWLVGWGLLERPVRGPRTEPALALLRFFQDQRGFAEEIGEWAFYAAVVLIVLALLKRFPYRYFFKTHRLLAIVYLVLVYHSVVLMKFDYWGSAVAPVMAVLMVGGCVGAVVSLLRRVGRQRRAVGVIEGLELHRNNRVLKVDIRLKDRWGGHQAGQFAFVTFDPAEGPHPFTISSAWRGDGLLHFHIKGIGDYTSTLPGNLKVGDLATVEGPYGRFHFESGKPRQIWVAGGIGITPFIARMQDLAKHPGGQPVDLFYSTAAPDEGFIARVRQLAADAGVALHLVVSQRDGKLDAERLCQEVPGWQSADVWFCGPAGFGEALRRGMMARGLSTDDFHQELFAMR